MHSALRLTSQPTNPLTTQDREDRRLPDPAELIHRPVAEHRLAVDKALVDRTKVAAVIGHGPVIAEHEVALGGTIISLYDRESV